MITQTNYSHPAATWVEEGYTRGPLHADGQTYFGYNFYWADQRDPQNGNLYYEHYIQAFPTHQYIDVGFKWIPNTNNWQVFNNHYQVGTSLAGAYAGGAQLGIEATDLQSAVSGNASNWRYKDGVNGTFHPAPAGGTVINPTSSGMGVVANGATTSAHTSNYCNYPPQPQAKPQTAGISAAAAPKLAPELSQELGGARATSSTAVETTRGAASKLLGFSVTGNQPVVTLQLKGNFTAHTAKMPPEAKNRFPRGSVINVVLEKNTGYVLDWGISNNTANLATLGKTTQG